jgi:holo-[acyl-carrier protein] synthase
MIIKIGTDIVYMPKFEKSLAKSRDYFKEKVFLKKELTDPKLQHLAGMFAAKEAVVKALGINTGKWLEIEIAYEPSGKPYLARFPQPKETASLHHELTISHDGDYAIANVIFYTN